MALLASIKCRTLLHFPSDRPGRYPLFLDIGAIKNSLQDGSMDKLSLLTLAQKIVESRGPEENSIYTDKRLEFFYKR